MNFSMNSEMKKMKDLSQFNSLTENELLSLKKEMSLAMNIEDLLFIQDYFKSIGRTPTETEVYV